MLSIGFFIGDIEFFATSNKDKIVMQVEADCFYTAYYGQFEASVICTCKMAPKFKVDVLKKLLAIKVNRFLYHYSNL